MKNLEDQLTAYVDAPNNDFDTLAKSYPGIPYSVYNSYVNMSESDYIQTILTDTTGVGSMLLRLAALTGRPIAYPLLAIRNAMADQNLDPSQTDTFTVTELKTALQTLNSDKGPEKDFTRIAVNVYVQAADRKNPQLAGILDAMFPQVPVNTPTFVPNTNSTWGSKPPPVGPPVGPTVDPTPSGGGGESGGRAGGGVGGGGDGTQPYVPEDKEPKSKPEEGSDWFIIIIVLLLLLGVGFAVTKRR